MQRPSDPDPLPADTSPGDEPEPRDDDASDPSADLDGPHEPTVEDPQ